MDADKLHDGDLPAKVEGSNQTIVSSSITVVRRP
jgi:hypothetical protein